MLLNRKSFNKVQTYETAKLFLSSAQGAFIALLVLMLSDETFVKKVIFAILIIILIYYLYTIAMQMLEITPKRNDR